MNKKLERFRRGRRTRLNIRDSKDKRVRLSVHRSGKHIYAQLIEPLGAFTIAAASSLEKEVKESLSFTGNIAAAQVVGSLIAKRGVAAGIKQVAFDRSGFKYHGRIKALAEAARAGGLEF